MLAQTSLGHRRAKKLSLCLLLTLFPVILTYALLFREMRSIPMFDDYQALIFYAVRFQELHGVGPRLLLALTAQHDEYKLIFEHLVVGLQLLISPQIHYRLLVILGNLFVLAILAIYWCSYFTTLPLEQRLLRFAPVSFLFVQLNYAETLDWAMCGLQMIPVIFFSLLSLHLLTRESDTRRVLFPLGCLAAILACLSSANGFVLGPVGFLLLIQQRAYRRIPAWCLSFAAALAMYLYHYTHVTRHEEIHPSLVQKSVYFLSFLGSAVENMHHFPIHGGSVALGLIVFATWLYSLRVGYFRSHPFGAYASLWLIVCAAGVAQLRSPLGLDLSLVPRYKIYSDLLLVFVYTFAVHRAESRTLPADTAWSPSRQRLAYSAALAFAVLLNLSSAWFGYRFLKHRADVCAQAFQQYRADPQHHSPMVSLTDAPILTLEPEFARSIMNEAIAADVFMPPSNP